MKTVCDVLGVTRSALPVRKARSSYFVRRAKATDGNSFKRDAFLCSGVSPVRRISGRVRGSLVVTLDLRLSERR